MRRQYVLLAKPWIVVANLLSAAGGFFLAAARGDASPGLFVATLSGIALMVASGCVFNNCFDRDIDARMARTRQRPLATGAISLPRALLYGAVLGLAGLVTLWVGTGGLVLAIVLAGFVIYVGVYTMLLKRHFTVSTLVGSLAGAAPPLAAYCAVANRLDGGGLLVLAIFSSWQVPHSYAIAMARADEYAAVDVPVLPVRIGLAATRRHLVWHTAAFVLATQLLPLFGYVGGWYWLVTTVLGAYWLSLAFFGPRGVPVVAWARRLYRLSIVTIFCVSLLMAVDAVGPVF